MGTSCKVSGRMKSPPLRNEYAERVITNLRSGPDNCHFDIAGDWIVLLTPSIPIQRCSSCCRTGSQHWDLVDKPRWRIRSDLLRLTSELRRHRWTGSCNQDAAGQKKMKNFISTFHKIQFAKKGRPPPTHPSNWRKNLKHWSCVCLPSRRNRQTASVPDHLRSHDRALPPRTGRKIWKQKDAWNIPVCVWFFFPRTKPEAKRNVRLDATPPADFFSGRSRRSRDGLMESCSCHRCHQSCRTPIHPTPGPPPILTPDPLPRDPHHPDPRPSTPTPDPRTPLSLYAEL